MFVSWLFELQDAQEKRIHLSRERWAHIQKHPEMTGMFEEIKDVLMMPDFIEQDEERQDVYYYRKYLKTLKQQLCVVVRYLNGHGFVITSYCKEL